GLDQLVGAIGRQYAVVKRHRLDFVIARLCSKHQRVQPGEVVALLAHAHHSPPLTVTAKKRMAAPSGSVVAPSGNLGPVYWAMMETLPGWSTTVSRRHGTGTPRIDVSTAAVSACPTADRMSDSPSASASHSRASRASSGEISRMSMLAGKLASMLMENALSNIFSLL